MRVSVRYFASLREALGAGESVELPPGATLGTLRDRLIGSSERHAAVLARGRPVRCALDQTMSSEEEPLRDEAEVAFFPPVTGG
jgi:molybdopterin synthase sulfur carrier subunit